MKVERRSVMKTAWRWLIYAIACLAVLMAVLWFMSIQVGLAMGWSGRTSWHVAGLIVFAIFVPSAITVISALKAITNAQQGDVAKSAGFGIFSIVLIPIVWVFLNVGLFG